MIKGNGIDIIEVRRIKNILDRYGWSFLERIFTDRELEKIKEHKNLYQHVAGRFAAKEAVFKALGEVTLSFKDIEIINDNEGRPYGSLINNNKNCVIHISISHIKNYAVANAIVT